MQTETSSLSADELRRFHEQGFLALEDVIPEAVLDFVASDLTDFIDRETAALVAEGTLSSTYADEPFERRLASITAENDELFKKLLFGHPALPSIFELTCTPQLLDIAESLCGPELIASSVYRIRPKVPLHSAGVVPWHQDSGYFEPYCDSSLILTCWIPFVDATPENGCLQVVPRVHRNEVFHHVKAHDGYLVIDDRRLSEAEVVTVPLRRGGVLLLTNRTPHQSLPNLTDSVRWSVDLRYQSADLPTNAPILRLPEEPVYDDAAPAACYPPEADFLVRSHRRPEQVLRSAEQFQRLREQHPVNPVTDRWGVRSPA